MITASCFRRSGSLLLTVLLLASLIACGGSAGTRTEVTVIVTGLQIAPGNTTIPLGRTQQFTATVTLSDGSTRDVTTAVTWTSSKTAVATISAAGLATSVAAGSTAITASFSGANGSATANITLTVAGAALASIAVTPGAPTIKLGATQQFSATGTFTDGSQSPLAGVVWSASGAASINSATGLATGIAAGSGTITATADAVSGSTTITVVGPVSIAVTPAALTVPLTLTPPQFTATATFSDTSTQDVTAVAIWFSDNTSVATVTAGTATLVGAGTANITASAAGLTSAPAVLTVNPAATALSILAPAVTYNADGVVTVTASSTIGTPTGNVSLTVDGGTPVTQTLVAGVATFTIPSPNAGDHALVADYAAQSNFSAGGATGTLHVDPAPTTLMVLAPTVTFNSNANITVTVSSLSGTPTGDVTLAVDGGAPLTQTLAGGTATFTLPSPNAGTYSLAASYAAQGNFGFSSGTGSLVVNPASTVTVIGAPTVTFNADGTVTVTVSSPAGTPVGNVSLSVDGGVPVTQALTAGVATFTLPAPNAGDHALAASFFFQGNFDASFASGILHVNPAATTVAINAPAVTFNADASITVTVNAVNSAAGTPTGNVTLSVDGGAALSAALSAGSATFTLTSPSAGAHTLAASYAAQGNFDTSSNTGSLTVNAAATTTTVSNATVAFNSNASVIVTVSAVNPAAGTPTGSVSLSVDSGAPTTQTLVGGTATFTVAAPAGVGAHTLSANYAAQGDFAASSGNGTLTVVAALQSIAVTPANTTIPLVSPPLPFTATGTYFDGTNTTTATVPGVQWTSSDTLSTIISLSGSGVATPVGPGTVFITATDPTTGISGSTSLTVQGLVSRFVYATDVFDSTIMGYAMDPGTGQLRINGYVTTGSRPSHLVLDPQENFLFVTNTLAFTVSSYAVGSDGHLTLASTVASGAPGGTSGIGPQGVAVVTTPQGGQFLYAVNSGNGTVSAFSINPSTGVLTGVGTPLSTGNSPSVFVAEPQGRFAYVPNFTSATISELSIDGSTGALTSLGTVSGPQSFAMAIDPSGTFLYAPDTALDQIDQYSIDAVAGTLTLVGTAANSPGSQTHGITFHPSGKFAYLANTGTNEVAMYAVDSGTGALTSLGVVSTGARSQPDTILVDATGQFLYVTHFGTNEISMFGVNSSSGLLSPLGTVRARLGVARIVATRGSSPVTYTPTFAFVANNNSNSITTYTIDGNPLSATYGQFTAPGVDTLLNAAATSPNDITTTLAGNFLYTSNSNGSVSQYTVDVDPLSPTFGALSETLGLQTGVSHPNTVTVEASGRFAYVGNNGNFLLNIFAPINSTTGALPAVTTFSTGSLSGLGIGACASTGFFPTGVTADPTGRFLFSADGICASVTSYTISVSNGGLTTPAAIPTVPAGPTTVWVTPHPSGRFLYAVNANDGTSNGNVTIYNISAVDGSLTSIGALIDTVTVGVQPSSIAIDPSGRFLYVGYQSGNSIDAYAVNPATGGLSVIQLGIKASPPQPGPVKLKVDPSGNFLYVANTGKTSGTVTTFRIDPFTGNLNEVGSSQPTGAAPSGITVIGTIQ